MGKKKFTSTKQHADEAFQPLIDYCQKNRGAMARVCKAFNKGLEKPVFRETIYRWLNLDAAKRSEPLFGSGLRLLAVWEDIKAEDAKAGK